MSTMNTMDLPRYELIGLNRWGAHLEYAGEPESLERAIERAQYWMRPDQYFGEITRVIIRDRDTGAKTDLTRNERREI